MRLALLVPAPLDALTGGYGYDRRIVDGLRALGHGVRVFELAGRHPLPDEAAERAAAEALSCLDDGEVPVVDGLGLPAFAPLAETLAERGAIGLIHHPTALETGFPEAEREALRARERDLLPRLARLVATSRPTAARLCADFGAEPARVGVVEPGTEEAPRARGTGSPPALLSVGALVPRKGHDVLFRALARLTDLDWTLTVVGGARDAVHARGLAALAEELGLASRVTFAGEVGDETLADLYDRADAFALASHWEGYGMAVAEALARGLPIAVTAGGALADLAPPGGAVVSPPGDHASLSRGLRRLLYDPRLRAEMGEVCWRAGQRLPRWSDRAAAFSREIEAARA